MSADKPVFLSLDGGGTSSRAALFTSSGELLARSEGAASNPAALGLHESLRALTALARSVLRGHRHPALEIGAGISGARNAPLRDALARGLCERLHARRAVVCSDVDALMLANFGEAAGIVVIAGTGSSVVAKTAAGDQRLFGGRGALFGDDGSAYGLAVCALRAAAASIDGLGEETDLVDALTHAAGRSAFAELVGWSRTATKSDVARLAHAVTTLAERGDRVAMNCVNEQARHLANLARAAAKAMGLPRLVRVYVAGGLFEQCALYRDRFAAFVAEQDFFEAPGLAPKRETDAALALLTDIETSPMVSYYDLPLGGTHAHGMPTEARLPDDVPLDGLSARALVGRMHESKRHAADAVAPTLDAVAQTVERIAAAFNSGGRLVYLGAGTSGRLGVMDASECPPTFGVDPGLVVGIIAGGDAALRHSVEGAEDDEAAAVADLQALHPPLSSHDVLVGIAASGTTPYVLSGIAYARDLGAYTALVSCNPDGPSAADAHITPDTGPEVLPGSTRLKAGTATKLVLNMLSTGAMTLSGRVYGGYMIGVRPVNAKLRKRAAGILAALTGLSPHAAADALDAARGRIPVALLMHRLQVDCAEAERRLEQAKGNVRAALGEI
ncbi:MAG: N-acetylmuramic acid 6-phosphate etherase [Candidatus Hydrogenedentes bacterium]|nr:N-acetylmuramic acid 6-phosphate etherase [Candidatus Hydrogenedentota bacterium]